MVGSAPVTEGGHFAPVRLGSSKRPLLHKMPNESFLMGKIYFSSVSEVSVHSPSAEVEQGSVAGA